MHFVKYRYLTSKTFQRISLKNLVFKQKIFVNVIDCKRSTNSSWYFFTIYSRILMIVNFPRYFLFFFLNSLQEFPSEFSVKCLEDNSWKMSDRILWKSLGGIAEGATDGITGEPCAWIPDKHPGGTLVEIPGRNWGRILGNRLGVICGGSMLKIALPANPWDALKHFETPALIPVQTSSKPSWRPVKPHEFPEAP